MNMATLIWVGIALIFLMLFSPGRAMLGALGALLWKLLSWASLLGFNAGQAILMQVWRAHMTLLQNLMPRNAALPSVAKKTTRKG